MIITHNKKKVHARNKAVDPTINWLEVARAMGGFTGAGALCFLLLGEGL